MTLGLFTNAATAMMGMSYDLNTIGQNISNMNTTGYKTAETDFKTQLSQTLGSPSSSPGSGMATSIFGVNWSTRTDISQQGSIVPTDQWSNVAINGNGFFMVAPPTSTGAVPTTASLKSDTAVQYTRAGDFTEQANGTDGKSYLVDGSGNYVMGWMADASGAIQTGTLTPVYLQQPLVQPGVNGSNTPTIVPSMPGSATTTAMIAANIPANDSTTTPNTSTASIALTDPSAPGATMQLTWTRVDGQTWTGTATGLTDPADPGATVSGSITVVEDSNQSISTVTPPLTQAFTVTSSTGATSAGFSSNTVVDPTTGATVSAVQSYLPTYAEQTVQLQAYDSNGTSHALDLGFENVGNGQWYIHGVTSETGAAITSAPVALTFNGAGQLVSPGSITVGATWADGQTTSVAVDISGLTQYAGTTIDVANTSQNGYAPGSLKSSTFNSQGILVGQFDNNQSRNLFQLPVATFTSENSLASSSGTLFQQTTGSGAPTVQAMGTGAAYGEMVAGSVESSSVDITSQFTNMILAQKAYSSNSQVFNVVDEMTTVASNLQT